MPSPDSRVDALVVDASGGATGAFVYEVYLVPKGAGIPGADDAALRMVDVAGPDAFKIEWRRPSLLVVAYTTAWVQRYANLRTVTDGKGARYVIEVRLIAPTGDESALPVRQRF